MPSDYGIRKQLFFENDAKLKWQMNVQHGNVERRGMINRVNLRLRGVDFLESAHQHWRANRLHDQLRPEARKAVQDALFATKKSKRNRADSEDNRVYPDQWVKNQIRTQAAENAIVWGGRPGLPPRGKLAFHRRCVFNLWS